jgi:hypothetical protein
MIVQSIDKLPVASGDRVALLEVTAYGFPLMLQKAGPQGLSKNQSMIRFTITWWLNILTLFCSRTCRFI